MSQSTLTRQVQALEADLGGQLFERGRAGVALTAVGQAFFKRMRPVVAEADLIVSDMRKLTRGHASVLRVGCLTSAAVQYLNPAIAQLRQTHPNTKVYLNDLSPGSLIKGLRDGRLDLVVMGNINKALEREFFVRRIATLPVVIAMPGTHRLAQLHEVQLQDLKGELFVGAEAEEIPGFNSWITQACRAAGFRPKFVAHASGLMNTLSLLVAEQAFTLLPALVASSKVPGVAFRPLARPGLKWELQVAWQRGKAVAPVRGLVDLLTRNK